MCACNDQDSLADIIYCVILSEEVRCHGNHMYEGISGNEWNLKIKFNISEVNCMLSKHFYYSQCVCHVGTWIYYVNKTQL